MIVAQPTCVIAYPVRIRGDIITTIEVDPCDACTRELKLFLNITETDDYS